MIESHYETMDSKEGRNWEETVAEEEGILKFASPGKLSSAGG